ncbi:hypothetical protein G7Y89_g6769 [Cudoniella acicularis]|uniref:DH domain-containing protein n=1 Tax=Cudoniella acicularis TaxID=354080 RepID=A0A8H4W249_9HELO|nr:hypothetical protein G7Y89_g6769 [Cudoniella acicularis]
MKLTRNSGFEDPVRRKIPELQKVDFAARRATIQRAYTKSIHEKEQKQIRAENMRRLSERHDQIAIAAANLKTETPQIIPETPPVPEAESQQNPEPSPKPLQITTSFPQTEPVAIRGNSFAMDQDSPTLGMPGTFIDDDEPPSAVTDIDNEPQTEQARLGRIPSVKHLEPSRLSSQIVFTSDELSPEQALFGINHEQESIDIMLAPTPVDEPRTNLPSRIDDQSQNPSPPGAFHDDKYAQPTITATLVTESPEGASPFVSRSVTPFESADDRSVRDERAVVQDVVKPADETLQIPPEAFYTEEPDYAVSPESPNGSHLQLPTLRTALAPPSVAASDVERDYLTTPVTDMEDEGSEVGEAERSDPQETFATFGADQEILSRSRFYRTSHQSSWTDYSVDSALEQSGQEDGLKSLSIPVVEEPEKKPTPPPRERSASPTPPVPPKPEGYSPLPSPGFVANSPRFPSPSSHQLPPLSTGNEFSMGWSDRPSFSSSTTPLWPDYSPPLPPVPPQLDEPSPIRPTREPPLPGIQTQRPPSSAYQGSHHDVSNTVESRRPSDDLYSEQPSTPMTGEEEKKGGNDVNSRLFKRMCLIKELIDTESTYIKDLNVVEEIYKGTAEACPKLDAGDIKVLFRNTNEIIAFGTKLLDDLKLAASPVYSPRSNKSRLSKTNTNTADSPNAEDRFSMAPTVHELSEDERDLQTTIGKAFGKHIDQMQVVYAEFLKTNEQATSRLAALETDGSVKVWLGECNIVAKDLTTAWSLDALLVKPVQRITRYQLMISELIKCTPDYHPDLESLQKSHRQIIDMLVYIDELKKRIQMVGKIVSSRKRKDSDVRTGIAKAFGLARPERVQGRIPEDDVYQKVHERYQDDYLRLQVVLRDVEYYTRQISTYVSNVLQYLSAMEMVMRMSPGPYPEIESKWTRFNISMRDMGTVALVNHIACIRLRVIEPFEQIIQLYGPPGLTIKKRAKRRLDYEKGVLAKNSGAKLNEKESAKVEEYEALNETLKIELVILSKKTELLGQFCIGSFVMIQHEWWGIWQKKLKAVLEESQLPKEIVDIVTMFNRDYKFVEGRAQELGIINGNFTGIPENAGSVGKPSDAEKKGRPSNLSSRSRGLSINSERTPSLPTPEFAKRHSGQFSLSPVGLAPNVPQFAYSSQPYSTGHSRAGSGSPATPDGIPGSRPSGSTLARPSTGRSFTSDSGAQRMSNDYNTTYRRESGSTYNSNSYHMDGPPVSSRPYSGIFHSAMPMQDGPEDSQRSSRNSSRDRNVSGGYNVLYLAASLFEFNISATKSEAGYPYLTYQAGEIFDVIGEKGELWLAKNQDDPSDQVGWIWSKHFARLASD